MALEAGDKAPSFKIGSDDGEVLTSASLKGAPYVVYFYPKDDTSGCTKEAIGFSESLKKFEKAGVRVIGVSKDPMKPIENFAAKFNLTFPLASDKDTEVCEAYGTWVEKSMYGRKYMGIERSTFLIDAKGKVAKIWRKVSVTGHAQAVMDAAKQLS